MNTGQLGSWKRSLGNLWNKAGNSLKNVEQRYYSLKWIGRVLFTGSALLLDWKSVQPQKRTSMSYLEIKHIHKRLLHCPCWVLLTVGKFIVPENMYLCLWSKASATEEQRYTFCLRKNELSRILLQRDQQKTHMILQSEIFKFGLWISSLLGACLYSRALFVTSGEALKLFVPLFLHLKIRDNTCRLLNLKGICED